LRKPIIFVGEKPAAFGVFGIRANIQFKTKLPIKLIKERLRGGPLAGGA